MWIGYSTTTWTACEQKAQTHRRIDRVGDIQFGTRRRNSAGDEQQQDETASDIQAAEVLRSSPLCVDNGVRMDPGALHEWPTSLSDESDYFWTIRIRRSGKVHKSCLANSVGERRRSYLSIPTLTRNSRILIDSSHQIRTTCRANCTQALRSLSSKLQTQRRV